MANKLRVSLRERKFARTRADIANAATHYLEQASYETLSVKVLCQSAEVSEATFFNYFPKKEDLIIYLDTLWSLELSWYGEQAAARERGLAVIDAVFRHAALQIKQKPGLMGEIIAWQARNRIKVVRPEISLAERMLVYPDLVGIETTEEGRIEGLLSNALQQAISNDELPDNTVLPVAMMALVSIFYGVPLVIQHSNPAGVGLMYRQQLALLWAGLKGAASGGVPGA